MKKLMVAVAAVAASGVAVAGELPASYFSLSYIQSTGAQWIDTGYTPSGTDKVEMKVNIPELNGTQCLFCSRGENNKTNSFSGFALQDSSSKKWTFRFDRAVTVGDYIGSVKANTDYVVTADGRTYECTTNGAVLGKMPQFEVTPPAPFSLFASYTTDPAKPSAIASSKISNLSSYKLYYFKVTDASGAVKVDMVPCMNASGVCGLYDLQRSQFYPSNGDMAFVRHGDVVIDNTTVSAVRLPVLDENNSRISAPDSSAALVLSGENPVLRNTTTDQPSGSKNCSSTSCTGPLKVFGFSGNYSRIAVYSLRIWDGDTLVRDFVPARRLSDGVGGLYDLVDHSGEEGSVPQFRSASGLVLPTKSAGEAPAEGYERLAWAQATGSQSIDTGFTPNSTTKVEVVYNSGKTQNNSALVGNKWSGGAWLFSIDGDHKWAYFPNAGSNKQVFNTVVDYADYRVTITSSKVSCEPLAPVSSDSLAAAFPFGDGVESGEKVASSTSISCAAKTSTGAISIFGFSNGSRSKIAAYSLKIWQNGVLVRDLVPARRLSDGVGGLYDLVDHSGESGVSQFRSASGFVMPTEATGEAPAEGYERLAWIQATGSQYVSTGITADSNTKLEVVFNTGTPVANTAIVGNKWAGKAWLFAVDGEKKFTFFPDTDKKYFGAALPVTDYRVTITASKTACEKLVTSVPMPVRFEPTGTGFSTAPVRSSSTQRGIALYDGTKIVVSDADLSSSWGRIPLMYDAGGFAQTPLTAAKLAALEADATLPKGAKLVYDETKKTLYCKRNLGLFIVVE